MISALLNFNFQTSNFLNCKIFSKLLEKPFGFLSLNFPKIMSLFRIFNCKIVFQNCFCKIKNVHSLIDLSMTIGRVEFRRVKIVTLLIFRNFGSSFPSLFLNGDTEKVV